MKRMGVMLDCSRNAVMHVAGVKRFVDTITLMGYNVLMLYTEDTYEVDGEPLFGYLRGRYSKEEMREIDEYCAEKGIELVPCIQTLAHLNQIFQWQPYRAICDVNETLLVGEERTYELIENMFKTLRSCVKTDLIHIGMDEAVSLGLGKYKDKHGYRPRSEILLEHLGKVCALAEKYGFTPLMWSDMFFSNARKGEYGEDLLTKLPESLQLVNWEYCIQPVEAHEKRFEKHLALGRTVWFASSAWKCLGFSAIVSITEDALRTSLTACKNKGIENTLITLWGDGGNDTPAYAVLANLFFQAEYLQGNTDEKSIAEKFEKTFGESWEDFHLFHLQFKDITLQRVPYQDGEKSALYNDPFLGKFDSTVVGGGREAKEWAEKAQEFYAAAKRSKNYGYVFESYARLCEVLEYKHELGAKTREAYQNDRTKLPTVIAEYDETMRRVERFVEAFRTMWYTDNKPHGFDVQELRLGGLLLRLKSCRERLEKLVNGEIEKIDELEEKIVNYYDGSDKLEKGAVLLNNYQEIATVNKL